MDPLSLTELKVLVAIAVVTVTTLLILLWLCCRTKKGEYTAEVWLESKLTAQQQHWHKSEELRVAVSSFHHRHARVPARLDNAREGHTLIIEKLLSNLREQGFQVHPEYVGSAYEGVKVARSEGNDDLEFDVMITMKLPYSWEVNVDSVPFRTGHVFLSLSEYNSPGLRTFFHEILTKKNRYSWEDTRSKYIIDGKKTIDKFFGEVQNWINSSSDVKGKILLRRHGPAIQMDVYEESISSDPPYYTVDVVPALEIEVSGKKQLYVAKPLKSRIIPDPAAWRQLTCTETQFIGSYSDERVDRYTPDHLKNVMELEKQLNGYRLRFAGHKIGTTDNNLEFKVLFIDDSKRNRLEVSRIKDEPDYVRLNLGLARERLNPRKQTTILVKAIQNCITSSSSLLEGKVHIRRNGPVVRLIVCETDEETYTNVNHAKTPLYYVDVILSYEVDRTLYVARPYDDWYASEAENSKAWRLSKSVEAKKAIYGSYGCLKMVLRILKALRNKEVALAPLTSYHLKTVILHMQNELDWNERYLGVRLMDALLRLEKCLKEKNLPHFYYPGVNLLSSMVEDCINSMGCRIHVLCTKEREMMKVLHASI